MVTKSENLVDSIQRISVTTIIPDGMEYDVAELRKGPYGALRRHIEGNFISLAGTVPFDETKKCERCAVDSSPHSHFISYLDVDVETLKRDLDKFCQHILSPFNLNGKR